MLRQKSAEGVVTAADGEEPLRLALESETVPGSIPVSVGPRFALGEGPTLTGTEPGTWFRTHVERVHKSLRWCPESDCMSGVGHGEASVGGPTGAWGCFTVGAGRSRLWASSPSCYLAASTADPIELRARIGSCRYSPLCWLTRGEESRAHGPVLEVCVWDAS